MTECLIEIGKGLDSLSGGLGQKYNYPDDYYFKLGQLPFVLMSILLLILVIVLAFYLKERKQIENRKMTNEEMYELFREELVDKYDIDKETEMYIKVQDALTKLKNLIDTLKGLEQ